MVRFAAAVALPVLAVVAMLPLRGHVENANIALGLVIVVLLVAVNAGRTPTIVAALSTALAFDVLFTRPFYSFRIATSSDVYTTLLLGVIGVIAGELVERARRSATAAASARAMLDELYRHAELAAGTESPGRMIGVVVDSLTELLDLKSCRYISGPLPTPMPMFTHQAIRIPANVDPAVRGLVALPVRAHGRLEGHLIMAFPTTASGTDLTSDQRHAAVVLADQLGVGLLRFHDR